MPNQDRTNPGANSKKSSYSGDQELPTSSNVNKHILTGAVYTLLVKCATTGKWIKPSRNEHVILCTNPPLWKLNKYPLLSP